MGNQKLTKVITIRWEGPLSRDKVVDEYHLDNEDRCDFGLYQIYGPHELYANKKRPTSDNVLLYIGKTTSGSFFSGRISVQGFCDGPEFEIYVGRIEGPQYDADTLTWEQAVSDAEKILINKYAPPYNSQGCGDLTRDRLGNPDVVLKNVGEKADLDSSSTVFPHFCQSTHVFMRVFGQ
jgi:hypothetical protein